MSNRKQLKLNSLLAILLGISLMIGETIRRFGNWGHWSSWADDFIIGLLLLISAFMVFKNRAFGVKLLITGWGFSSGLLYGSFFSKLTDPKLKFDTNIEPNLLITLIGFAFTVSIFGLVWILRIEWRASSQQRI